MKRSTKMIVVLGIVTGFALLIWQPLSRFLFHPDGLSIAPAQLCVRNQAGKDLVLRLSIMGGEALTTLTAHNETVCAASPEEGRKANIRVGVSEKAPQACLKDAFAGETLVLERFTQPANCDWKQ